MARRPIRTGIPGWSYPPVYPYMYPPFPPYGYPPIYQPMPPMSPEDELAYLENYKRELEAEKADIEQEIREVENRIKELKDMIEGGGQFPPRPPGPPV